jgi:outer membrane protein insertion porin family
MRIKVLSVLWAALMMSGLSFGQARAPQGDREYEIADIIVEGVRYLDHNALISVSGLTVGDKINLQGEELSNAMKRLWKQSLLSDVQIIADRFDGSKVYLILKLTERPRLTKIQFEGVKKSQITEIEDKIDLIRGRILTDALVKNTELAVRKYYIEKGFYDVEVKTRQIPDTITTNGARLVINVDRKQKVKIEEIYFEGNESYPDFRLRMKMKETSRRVRFDLVNDLVSRLIYSKPKHYWQFITQQKEMELEDVFVYITDHANINIFKNSKLVRKEYKDDHQKLVTFYNNKGFRDMEIVRDSVYRNPDGTLSIKIVVDEGQKYYFRDIIWSGNYVHSDETLDAILGIRKGDIYNAETINRRINFNPTGDRDVSALYMDDGYLFFNIEPVELRIDQDSIDIEMRIYEGSQANLRRVSIAGNTRTNDHVVMREIRTIPGEKFSREKIIRTQRELSQLGYFNPETVNPNVVPNPNDGTADVEWQLEEISNDQIQLSGGWGGFIGFIGTVGITFNNFSAKNLFKPSMWDPLPVGDGQVFGIQVQANGRRFQSYSASFTEPWLGGKKPNALTVGLNRSVQRNIDFFTNQEFGYFNVSRASVSLTRRLNWPDNWFMLTNSFQYFLYELNNFGLNLGCETCNSNSFLFNTVIARNSIDNPIFPRTGSNISLSISATPPYSLLNGKDYDRISNAERYRWMEYHKWMFDASFFTPIMNKLVVNARAHVGVIGQYSDRVGIGPFERFYLGGDGITGQMFLLGTDIIGLRGYPNNRVVPEPETVISWEERPGGLGREPVARSIAGGTIYNKFVMETRFLISPNPSATIFVLGFAEAGNTWNDPSKYNLYDLKRAAGVGARIFMPAFGTIGIDWGYGFDIIPGDTQRSGSQIHFMIGQQFR